MRASLAKRSAFRRLISILFTGSRIRAASRARPWEPHKCASKAEQNAKLAFLLEWVRDYYRRDGELSLTGHRALFSAYAGPKREVVRA